MKQQKMAQVGHEPWPFISQAHMLPVEPAEHSVNWLQSPLINCVRLQRILCLYIHWLAFRLLLVISKQFFPQTCFATWNLAYLSHTVTGTAIVEPALRQQVVDEGRMLPG